MSKKIFIITGPMGSGNHMFSKIFDLHPDVCGFTNINDGKYRPYREEPHNEIWRDLSAIDRYDWSGDYHVISLSTPYIWEGESVVPNFKAVVDKLQEKGFAVHVGIIGRDKNITDLQQRRLRGTNSTQDLLDVLPYLTSLPHTFLSFELAQLFKADYIKSIGIEMGLPVDVTSNQFDEIVGVNSNAPYVAQIEEGVYDSIIKERIRKGRENRGVDTDVDKAIAEYEKQNTSNE